MKLSFFIASCLTGAAAIVAQDTPTEIDAARDVLAKMSALEKSIDVPALVAKLAAGNPARDAVARRALELMQTEMLALADDITRHPEVGYEERESVRKLKAALEKHGFEVRMGAGGLETAFVAQAKLTRGGQPVLGVIAEYDALRGTKGAFHGDQHSAQGPIGIAAAIAVAEYLEREKIPGSVVIYGTPSEEKMPPNAKVMMLEAGVFRGADIIVRSHSSIQTMRASPGFGTCCLNIDGVRYVFGGAPAHQLAAWNGRNALEAVIHLFENIDSMRSSIRPEGRIQGVITEGGAAPNVVPDRTAADFYIRYPDAVYLQQVHEMVDNAARAAALSTGTKVRIDFYGRHRDGISLSTLEEAAFAYSKMFGATHIQPKPGSPIGFEETGMLSREIPGVGFNAFTSNGAYHTYEMEADALTEVGHSGFTVDAQGMAALLVDYATRPDFRAVVQREHDALKGFFGEYQQALEKAYRVPSVPDPH